MCIYSPMLHTLSYCVLIGKCALIRSNMVCLLSEYLYRIYVCSVDVLYFGWVEILFVMIGLAR